VDEIVINISVNGEVLLNDEPMDKPGDRRMPQLTGTLLRLKQGSDAAKTSAMVTIVSEPEREV